VVHALIVGQQKYCRSVNQGYDETMSTVQEIEHAIEKLPREEVFVLTNWLSTHFSELWDRQIEEDISAGLLDDLAAEAVAEHRAGKSLPLPAHEE
jgi:hypothetical protein